MLKRSPLGRRALIQAVKRSPLDLRPLLAIEPRHNAAALAHVISAYSRIETLPPAVARERMDWALGRLADLRSRGYEEPCWGYHFDVETRFFFYPASTPNTIATAFAAFALLDADARGAAGALALAEGAGEFLLRRIDRTDADVGSFFGYFPGDRTPIHNASLLAAAVLAELSIRCDRDDFAAAARPAVDYALARQRPDGSWPYAETPAGDWVDGFHTGYVLDALLRCERALGEERIGAARRRGLAHYAANLFAADGTPKYFATDAYPLDTQSAAQAIATFSEAARAAGEAPLAGFAVLDWARRRMLRGDGAFAFQRRRLWLNRTPHVRWVQAPMLDALTRLDRAAARADRSEGGG